MESPKCLLVFLRNMDCLHCVGVILKLVAMFSQVLSAVVDELTAEEGLKKVDKER